MLLHLVLCGTITSLHRLARRVLTDESVRIEWELPNWEIHPDKLHATVSNAVYSCTLLVLLVVYLAFPAWCYMHDFSSLFLVCMVHAVVFHGSAGEKMSDKACAAAGCVAWWWLDTPLSHAAVFYSIANAPFYIMLVLGDYNRALWITAEATAVIFWTVQIILFTANPNLIDSALLPLSLYYDCFQWVAAFDRRSKQLQPDTENREALF
jgi:hypothetical protein